MMFARFGFPKILVMKNGVCLTSIEFTEFTSRSVIIIKLLHIVPYHPSSNCQAERAVQIFKLGIKKQSADTLYSKLSHFLFIYKLTPHATIGVSTTELLLNRWTLSHLDLAVPSLRDHIKQQQQKQKTQHDRNCNSFSFYIIETLSWFVILDKEWSIIHIH